MEKLVQEIQTKKAERKTLDANNNEVITNVYAKSTAIVIIETVINVTILDLAGLQFLSTNKQAREIIDKATVMIAR